MKEGSIVVMHLVEPSEKYWGKLETLSAAGATIRGINLHSFEDWLRELASGEPPSLDLATIFFPLRRVERIFLDEPVGMIESMAQRFEQRAGRKLDDYLAERAG